MDAQNPTTAGIRATMTDEQILLERKLTCEAINGAMAFGYQNSNSPPSEDHWLAPFWEIGRRQAELEACAALPSDAAQTPEPACTVVVHEGRIHFIGTAPQIAALENMDGAPLYAAPVAPAAAAPSDDAKHVTTIDVRDLFAFLRAAWREGQHYDREDIPDQADSWSAATDYANKTIEKWTGKSAGQPDERAAFEDALLAHFSACSKAENSSAISEATQRLRDLYARATTPQPVAGSVGHVDYYDCLACDLTECLSGCTGKCKSPSAAAPSLTTDAGAVLTDEQHEAIVYAIRLIAKTMDAPLSHAKTLRALLAAHPTEQRMSNVAISACALMIKGICMTKPRDEWMTKIEERIRFMLASGAEQKMADSERHVTPEALRQAFENFSCRVDDCQSGIEDNYLEEFIKYVFGDASFQNAQRENWPKGEESV